MTKPTSIRGEIKTLFVDLDGVLADFHTSMAKLWGLDPKALKEEDWAALGEWGLSIPKEGFWERIEAKGPDFWSGLAELPWARRLWDACNAACDTVVLLTSPGPFPASPAGKYAWIRAHLDTTKLLIGGPKHVCSQPGAILIDDRSGYGPRWEARGGQLLSLKRPWNTGGIEPETICEMLEDYASK